MTSFENFPGKGQNVFNSRGGGSEKVPGEGTLKRFQVPGGGKVKSREGI